VSETDTRRHPPTGVLVALALVVAGIQLAHYTSLVEYTYHVAETTQAAATDAAQAADNQTTVLYQFSGLPGPARDAFLQAYESANDQTTIRGMDRQVTALAHTGDTPARPGDGLHYVVYQERYYEFVIRHPMSLDGPVLLFGYLLAAIGLAYTAYLGLTRGPRTAAFLALAAGIACFLGAYGLTGWWTLNDLPSLFVAGGLCASLPAVGVWVSYDSRSS